MCVTLMLVRVVALLTILISGALSAACPPDFSGTGEATFYILGAVNACDLPNGDGLVAAINGPQYDGSAHCGECLDVQGPGGSVVVRIVDQCPGCAEGDLDLSETAFERIADPIEGRVPIAWTRVECPVAGPVNFRFQGSNPFFLKVQASNHRYGVTAMTYFDGSDHVAMDRTSDNYFQATGVPNVTDVRVRVTATTGETLEADLGDPSQSGFIPGSDQFASCSDILFADGFESP